MKKVKVFVLILVCAIFAVGLVACKAETPYFPDWVFDSLKAEDATVAEGADVRIMSMNVLAGVFSEDPVKPRAQMFAETLKHYNPDIVGLQEFDKEWHKYLLNDIPDYTIVFPKNGIIENRTPIIYNNKTLKLIDSGFHVYSKKDGSQCRLVTFGVFETISTGKKVAVTNTHWDFGMSEQKIEYRNTQIKELIEIVNKIDVAIPVFAVGDFNAYEKTIEFMAQSYIKFVEDSNMIDVKFLKDIDVNVGEGVKFEDEAWDHIFLKGNAKPLSFNILANDFYKFLSDHFPIYTDVKLG